MLALFDKTLRPKESIGVCLQTITAESNVSMGSIGLALPFCLIEHMMVLPSRGEHLLKSSVLGNNAGQCTLIVKCFLC